MSAVWQPLATKQVSSQARSIKMSTLTNRQSRQNVNQWLLMRTSSSKTTTTSNSSTSSSNYQSSWHQRSTPRSARKSNQVKSRKTSFAARYAPGRFHWYAGGARSNEACYSWETQNSNRQACRSLTLAGSMKSIRSWGRNQALTILTDIWKFNFLSIAGICPLLILNKTVLPKWSRSI